MFDYQMVVLIFCTFLHNSMTIYSITVINHLWGELRFHQFHQHREISLVLSHFLFPSKRTVFKPAVYLIYHSLTARTFILRRYLQHLHETTLWRNQTTPNQPATGFVRQHWYKSVLNKLYEGNPCFFLLDNQVLPGSDISTYSITAVDECEVFQLWIFCATDPMGQGCSTTNSMLPLKWFVPISPSDLGETQLSSRSGKPRLLKSSSEVKLQFRGSILGPLFPLFNTCYL